MFTSGGLQNLSSHVYILRERRRRLDKDIKVQAPLPFGDIVVKRSTTLSKLLSRSNMFSMHNVPLPLPPRHIINLPRLQCCSIAIEDNSNLLKTVIFRLRIPYPSRDSKYYRDHNEHNVVLPTDRF